MWVLMETWQVYKPIVEGAQIAVKISQSLALLRNDKVDAGNLSYLSSRTLQGGSNLPHSH